MGQVLNGSAYNRKCDVYSFGICLWEIYCCDMPYPDLSFSEVTSAVVRQNLRPEIPRCCPSSLANVMKRCWDANPDKRPEMDEVVTMLEAIDTSKGGGMIPVDQPQGCSCFRKYRGPWKELSLELKEGCVCNTNQVLIPKLYLIQLKERGLRADGTKKNVEAVG